MTRARCLAMPLLLSLVLAACNPAADRAESSGEPPQAADPSEISGTIDVWGFGTDDANGKSRVAAFKRQFPNVKVQLTPGDFDEQKFLSAVASGNPPDVVHIGRNVVGSYASRGALQPLDDRIEANGFDMSVFYESALNDVRFQGQTYGFPQFNNVVVAYLNNPVLEQAGIDPAEVDFSDWDALARINEQLSESQGRKVEVIGFDSKVIDYLPLWAAANGGRILSEDGTEVLLDSPEVAEAVEYTAQLPEAVGGEEKKAAFIGAWDIFGEKNPIAAEQLGITLFEQWYVSVLAETTPNVDVTIKPFTTHESGEEISYANGLSFSMPKGAENPDAAYAFMQFMSSEEAWVTAAKASKKAAEAGGGVYTGTYTGHREADGRIFSEVYEPSGNKSFDEAVEVILDVQEKAVSVPANPAGAEITQEWQDAVNEVLLGRASAEEALSEADRAAQEALDRAAK